MQGSIFLTLCLQLAVGAVGTSCAAGYKHLADLTGLTCSTSATDAASCSSNCCEEDTTTCGGAFAKFGSDVATKLECPFDSYRGADDTWKKTQAFETTPSVKAADIAATRKTWVSKCCTKKAKCGAAPTCKAGMGPKAGLDAVMCATDAASCADSCCEQKTTTCGGYYETNKGTPADVACATPASQYLPTDDTWKKIVITGAGTAKANFQNSCCVAKATCASTGYSCKAGHIRDDTKKTDACPTDGLSCATNTGTCCKANGCGAYETTDDITCTQAGSYYPGKAGIRDTYWQNKKTDNTNKGTDCCTPKATCKNAVCPAGDKKKTGTGVDALSCPNNADSCATSTSCCEKDTTKCGGLTGISCPYGFYDERSTFITSVPADKKKDTAKTVIDAWKSKPATEATKNTDCCTPKAVCTPPVVGTTTPPPAAPTTTPVTAIRRYSEHTVDGQDGSDHPLGANIVWLGVGGLIGMSVLFVVQGLRSRMQVASAEIDLTDSDAREVGETLLRNAPVA